MMAPYKNRNGDGTTAWNWHKIVENVIMVITITLLTTGFSWFMTIRDMKRDIQDLKKVSYSICNTLWEHIHPSEPNPFVDLRSDK